MLTQVKSYSKKSKTPPLSVSPSGKEAEGHNFYVTTTEESPFSVSPESLSRTSPQPEPGLLPVSERGFRTEQETLTWPFAACPAAARKVPRTQLSTCVPPLSILQCVREMI